MRFLCDPKRFGGWGVVIFLAMTGNARGAEETTEPVRVPSEVAGFFQTYCTDCHSGDEPVAELDLTVDTSPLNSDASIRYWERIHEAFVSGRMPPEEAVLPAEAERRAAAAALREWLTGKGRIRPMMRRLNRRELRRTVEQLFDYSDPLPASFPPEDRDAVFDTHGPSLVISAPFLEACDELALNIAESLFPEPDQLPSPRLWTISPDDMAISYSSGSIRDGAMRLVTRSQPMMRSCSWPVKFEAPVSGVYHVSLNLRRFGVVPEPPRFVLKARPVAGSDGTSVSRLRTLAEWEVSESEFSRFSADVTLYSGETLVFYYANAPLSSDKEDKGQLKGLLEDKFAANPRLLAAWLALDHGPGIRGGIGWERVKKLQASAELNLSEARLDSPAAGKLIRTMLGNPVLYVETLSYEHFEQGPAIDIGRVEVEGPRRLVADPEQPKRLRKRRQLFGAELTEDFSDKELRAALLPVFLKRVWRRKAVDSEIADLLAVFHEASMAGRSQEDAMRSVIRAALLSPQFLFHDTSVEAEGAVLRVTDAAAVDRLSYFLTGRPPDAELQEFQPKIHSGKVRRDQALRLLNSPAVGTFAEDFVEQWLQTNRLPDIMPDAGLIQLTSRDLQAIRQEPSRYFRELIEKNEPLSHLIAPGYVITTAAVARKIYQLPEAEGVTNNQLRRWRLPSDSFHGGLFGMAGPLTATANGVDTQPVLRGVWMLEKVLGEPPPPPPEGVPALTPDTRGKRSVRELLKAHTSDSSCAGCHRQIDPYGLLLESFDPVGRYRSHYPEADDSAEQIITEAELPNGTIVADVSELRRILAEKPEPVAACLLDHLVTYAFGRRPDFQERQQIRQLVSRVSASGGGIRDIIVEFVGSPLFLNP